MRTKKSPISLLDDLTINQIAAGEVVENSSSVVKELVENAIDAKASEVYVETERGGLELVRVSDDGVGMDREDLLRALQRHATSKILKSEDLEKVLSLGFRGEALPSIASVSKMHLHSEACVEVEGGKVISVKERARARGTTVEVRSLFYNVPARRKFQKSAAQSTAEIHRMLTNLALSHPDVQFRWVHEGEERLFVEKKSSLRVRIAALLGEEILANAIASEEEGYTLTGFLGGDRPNRTGQYLFINQRFVLSPFIAQHVLEGVGTRLPMRRFPCFVLHLTLPPDLVDVNVHPQKREVRLRDQERIGAFVRQSVDRALQKKSPRYESCMPTFHLAEEAGFTPPPLADLPLDLSPAPQEWELPLPKVQSVPWGVVGSFLLVEHKEGVEVVDLNRARSELLGDRIEKSAQQKLLIPLTLEFSAAECSRVQEALPLLERFGFSLRSFGGNAFVCEALPAHLAQEEVADVIGELLEGRGQRPLTALKRQHFTLEEGRRLFDEIVEKGMRARVSYVLTSKDLEKKFR